MFFNVQINFTDATEAEIAAFFNRGSSAAAMDALKASMTTTGHITTTGNVAAPNPNHQQVMGVPSDDENGPANVNAPAVDTAGMPWDERIHSKNKNLNADGTWRAKRNVDGAMKAAVEAELKLRAGMSYAAPNFTPPSSQVAMPHHNNGNGNGMTMPHQNGTTMPHEQHQQPQPSNNGGGMDFNAFMMHMSGQMNKRDANGAPLITVDYLAGVCQRLGAQFGKTFNAITDIMGDQAAINSAIFLISADGRWN